MKQNLYKEACMLTVPLHQHIYSNPCAFCPLVISEMAEAHADQMAGAQAEPEWKRLYVKRLSQKDLTEKLTLPVSHQKSFLDSIPRDKKRQYLSRGIIPATYCLHQSGDRYIEFEVQFYIYFPGGDISQEICSFELPPLEGGFHLDMDAKIEYCWRDKKLHLRASTAYPMYAEIDQTPTGWLLLGQKKVSKREVSKQKLRLNQANMTEFYNSIPSPQLKEALHLFVGFQVGIWTRGLDCVSGHIKPAETVRMDPTNLALEISCKEAFKENSGFFRENTTVEVYYQWAYGTPFVAIVPDASVLPPQTGEHYSLF